MTSRSAGRKLCRWVCVLTLALLYGGTTALNVGCNTEVSSIVLSGFQDLSYSLVDAVSQVISDQLDDTTTTTTTTTTTDTTDTTDTTSSST